MESENKSSQAQIVARLIELRSIYRRTQQECADALGISQSAYAEMESGQTRVRRRDMVTLAVLFGIEPEDAFNGLLEAA